MLVLKVQDKNNRKSRNKPFGPRLVFALSRILGCFPFDDSGKPSIARVAYSILFLGILTSTYTWISYLSYRDHLRRDKSMRKEEFIKDTVKHIVTLGSIVIILINSASLLARRKTYPTVMRNVNNIKVHRMNSCFSVTTLLAFGLTTYFQVRNESLVFSVAVVTVTAQHVMFTAQYILLSNRWNCYLKLLTKAAAKFDEKKLEAHSKVIEAHKLINDLYGLPILLSVLIAFVITVQKLFVFYVSIKSQQIEYPTIFSITFYSILIYWIASVSDYSSFLADEFNKALFEMMNKDTMMLAETTLRLYLVKKHSISFTACGFFTVGYPFVTSLIAAAVTYLVVLIQFAE